MASHLIKSSIAVCVGLGLYFSVFLSMKAFGKAPECPWSHVASLPVDAMRFSLIQQDVAKTIALAGGDDALNIELLKTRLRPFWIRRSGGDMNGAQLLAYLIGEQEWLAKMSPTA